MEIIKNISTGDSIEFIQTTKDTNGKLLKFKMTLAPKSTWAKKPRHFHPYQKETFHVLSGELNLTVGNKHYILNAKSDKVVIDKFTSHSFWNDTKEKVVFLAEIYNPRQIENGLRLTYELSERNKINKKNIPFNPLYTLVLMNYFDAYLPIIPWKIQRFIFKIGGKIGISLGYDKIK